jgi:hypothetical protein
MHRHGNFWIFVGVVFCLSGCSGQATDPQGRETAEWVFEAGGTLVIIDRPTRVTSADDLPEGEFAIGEIDLKRANIDAAGLEKLAALTNLMQLGLYQTNITDKSLDPLVRIATLTDLDLSYTLVTDEGLAKLGALDNLKKLYLHGTAVTDEAVERFQSSVSSCQIFR